MYAMRSGFLYAYVSHSYASMPFVLNGVFLFNIHSYIYMIDIIDKKDIIVTII